MGGPDSSKQGQQTGPIDDILAEAQRVVRAAAAASVPLRLAGGAAVMLCSPVDADPALLREPKDIDAVTTKKQAAPVTQLMVDLGYGPDEEFNAFNGHRRLLYHDAANARQVDIFVGSFEMCHTLPIADRMNLSAGTLPLAEILLMKLQIFELNEKDQRDILNLLAFHPVAGHDDQAINGDYVAALCASDWGLWRTCTLNLERSISVMRENYLGVRDPAVIETRLRELEEQIHRAPKSRRWKIRSRVGDRVRWYEDVEEVA